MGFKALKLDQSNFKPWKFPAIDIPDEELIHQMELNADHIDPNASQEELLYELLLKAGLKPTEQIRGNDQLKANAAKTFATFNRDKEGLDRIEFKTV